MSRVRVALEGSRELRFAGGRSVTPSVEVGVRQDGGDAETGTGLETGFGVVFLLRAAHGQFRPSTSLATPKASDAPSDLRRAPRDRRANDSRCVRSASVRTRATVGRPVRMLTLVEQDDTTAQHI